MPPENNPGSSTTPTIGFHQLRQAWEISSLRDTLVQCERDFERLQTMTTRLQDLIEEQVEKVRKLFSNLEPHEFSDATTLTPILSEALSSLIEIRDASRHLGHHHEPESGHAGSPGLSDISSSGVGIDIGTPADLPAAGAMKRLDRDDSGSDMSGSPTDAPSMIPPALACGWEPEMPPVPRQSDFEEADTDEADDWGDPKTLRSLKALRMNRDHGPPGNRASDRDSPRPVSPPPTAAMILPSEAPSPAVPPPSAPSSLQPTSWLLQPATPPREPGCPAAPTPPPMPRPRTAGTGHATPPLNGRLQDKPPSSQINWLQPAKR